MKEKKDIPLLPQIKLTLDLTGPGGNAFAIISKVSKAIRDNGGPSEDFVKAAFAAQSYDSLLALVNRWVTVTK